MKTLNLLKTLLLTLACILSIALSAQDEGLSDEEKREIRDAKLDVMSNDLEETRQFFQFQEDQAMRSRSYNKIDRSLQGFLETEFMKNFKELKLEMESVASTFKAHSMQLQPEEVAKARKAYIRMADKFNKLLDDIKRDFLDRKKRKHISEYPQMYAAALELRLRDIQDDYSQDFALVVSEATGKDVYSATPFLAVFTIIKLAADFTNYLAKVKSDNRRIKEEHLNQYFIEPHKFKSWQEIETINGNNYDYYDNYRNNDGGGYDNYNNYQPEPFNDTTPAQDVNNLPPPPPNGQRKNY